MRGWFASRPGPGVQPHPDGCVVHAFRCASRSGADRRSAFPVGVRASASSFPAGVPGGRRAETFPVIRRHQGGHAVSLRFAQRCRPEVGVPVRARHPFPLGYVPRRASSRKWANRGFAALCAAVPTGGRRSRACAPSFSAGVRADVRHPGRYAVSLTLRALPRQRAATAFSTPIDTAPSCDKI